jgi:PAS domain S-box-containing protein
MDKVLTSREPLRMEDERAGMHFETSVYPVLNPEGDVESMAIFASDVTARKVAEDELRQRESKYHSLVDTITHGVEEIDLSGVITFANAAYHRIFEYEDGELIGASVLELAPSEHDRAALRDYLAFVANEEPAPVLMTAKKKTRNGLIIDVELAWDYKRNNDGQVTGLVAVVTDVTAAKQAAEALRQSAQRNASLIDAIPDMMFTLNRRGAYLDFVPARGHEPYISADEFLGRTVSEVLPAALALDIMRSVELALDTGFQQQLEYELDVDGEKHEYEARILKSKEDEALAIVRDVTAAKRLEREEQLRKVRDELEGSVEKLMLGKNPYGLTFREFTVLHLVADGEADKAIADQLGISTFTVSKHVANILGKMDAGSRTEACVRALREGLLS